MRGEIFLRAAVIIRKKTIAFYYFDYLTKLHKELQKDNFSFVANNSLLYQFQ